VLGIKVLRDILCMKPLKIIYYIFLAFIVAVALLLIISAFPITGNIKFMIVQSGSMTPAIKMGSIVMVKSVDEYKIGDVISFGEVTRTKAPTTHRVYDIKVVEGEPYYITKGDANNAWLCGRFRQKTFRICSNNISSSSCYH